MDDQQFFEEYVNSCRFIFETNLDAVLSVKDNECKYQLVSNNMMKILGLTDFEEVRNKTTKELLNKFPSLSKFAEKTALVDIKVKTSKKSDTHLEILPYQGALRLVLAKRSPIINPKTENVVGIYGDVTDMVWPNALKLLFSLHGAKGLLINHKNIKDPLLDYPLTNMQHMVLFFCINKYSYSEIAVLLNEFGYDITPARVNDYFEQLKLIFHVRTKASLIEKAIGLNFHVLLPCDLFNTINTIDIKREIAEIICCNCKLNICTVHPST